MKENLSIVEMLRMQQDLWEKHSAEFLPLSPQYGKESILWMIGEIGECISIIKKKGDTAIVQNSIVRAAFVEEMCDVLMYYFDVMLRFNITSSELSSAFIDKHNKNMNRNFKDEYSQEIL